MHERGKRVKNRAAHKETKKERAIRIDALFESMDEKRIEALEEQIREIASGFEMRVENAEEEAAEEACQEFAGLIGRGYTEDEIDAVLTNENSGRISRPVYRDVREVWKISWLKMPDRDAIFNLTERK